MVWLPQQRIQFLKEVHDHEKVRPELSEEFPAVVLLTLKTYWKVGLTLFSQLRGQLEHWRNHYWRKLQNMCWRFFTNLTSTPIHLLSVIWPLLRFSDDDETNDKTAFGDQMYVVSKSHVEPEEKRSEVLCTLWQQSLEPWSNSVIYT